MFRRFFYRLLKKDNPRIWAKRLNKVTFQTQLEAAQRFVLKYFGQDDEQFALYFLRMFKLKYTDTRPFKYE